MTTSIVASNARHGYVDGAAIAFDALLDWFPCPAVVAGYRSVYQLFIVFLSLSILDPYIKLY